MTLVRYRTGDYVKVAQAPDAEFPWLEVSAVVGRDYEFLVSGTGRHISLTAINMHDRIFDGLYAVQFAQEEPGMVEFRYQPGPQWRDAQEESIRAGLRKKLGDDFQLAMRRVTEVEKTNGGKARWLISKLSKDLLRSA